MHIPFSANSFGAWSVLISGFLFIWNCPAQQPGSIDPTFDAEIVNSRGAHAIALLSDGKLLVGGQFGIRGKTTIFGFVRLLPNGRINREFPLKNMDYVGRILIQEDGKILTVSNSLNPPVDRLHPDGSLDLSFRFSEQITSDISLNYLIQSISLQTDGKILLRSPVIKTMDGQSHGLIRLNPDGSLDESFSQGAGFELERPLAPTGLAIQPDGGILATGDFSSYNGLSRRHLVRILPDGEADADFDPEAGIWQALGAEADEGVITAIAVASNGSVFLGVSVNEESHWLVSINSTGEVHAEFGPVSSPVGRIQAIALAEDGRVYVSGSGLARVLPGGEVDETFLDMNSMLSESSEIKNLILTSDGKILAAGEFELTGTYPRKDLARFYVAEQSPSPPSGGIIPREQSAPLGAMATFEARAEGYPPPEITWKFNGEPIPGETNRRLHLKRTQLEHAGAYSFSLANEFGEFQSGEAVLTVAKANARTGGVDDRFRPEEEEEAVDVDFEEIAMLPDGGLLAARFIKFFDESLRYEIVKYFPDGRLDPKYNAEYPRGEDQEHFTRFTKIHTLPDGSALVGGFFVPGSNLEVAALVRLDRNGRRDPSFAPRFKAAGSRLVIEDFYVDDEGNITVVGSFSMVNGKAPETPGLIRLHPTGEIDEDFSVEGIPDREFDRIFGRDIPYLNHIVSLNDKLLLIGNGMVFIQDNGTWDGESLSFRGGGSSQADISVDGLNRFLVTSPGSAYVDDSGVVSQAIWRIQSDLNPDAAFRPVVQQDVLDSWGPIALDVPSFPEIPFIWEDGLFPTRDVNSHGIQEDGKILIGGGFDAVSGVRREGLARLFEDGSLDESFDIGKGIAGSPHGTISNIVVTDRGTIYIAGSFDEFNGYSRQGIARLLGDPVMHLDRPRHDLSKFSVQARTMEGARYIWEYTVSLVKPRWERIREVEGDGSFQQLEDDTAEAAMRFYRLRRQSP